MEQLAWILLRQRAPEPTDSETKKGIHRPRYFEKCTEVDTSLFTGEIQGDSDKSRLSVVQTIYNDYFNI